MLERDMITKYA